MNHSRNDFFTHATLAADKNRHIDRRDLQYLLADSNHLRTSRQKAQILGHLVTVITQRLILRGQLLLLPRFQHRRVQFRLLEGLGQIVVRPDADGFDDGSDLVRA